MTKGILENKQFILTIKDILFILANKAFIDFIIKIIPKNKSKTKVIFFFNNNPLLFIYDVKITILD